MKKTLVISSIALISSLLSAQLLLHVENPTAGQGIEFAESGKKELSTSRQLEFENEYVRVWKTTILPQQPIKMHRHECARVIYGIEGGSLARIEENGQEKELVFDTGKAYWYEADPKDELHGDINRSDKPIVVLVVEVKAAQSLPN